MLHNSPLAVGIAWEKDNVYWVFDGYHHSITRYDFASDHGPGGSDHSDGYIARHVEGKVLSVRGVSSHMEIDVAEKKLYIADTGNHRIAVLDLSAPMPAGPSYGPDYDGCVQYRVNNTPFATFVDFNLKKPSGLALHDGLIYVSDNETSQVYAYDKNAQLVDSLDLSSAIRPGNLQAITFDAQGKLYVLDSIDSKVFQISAKPEN
jgi:sugar lactone lactonase YvrE